MPLTLRIRQKTAIPVEVDDVRCDVVRTLTADQVLRLSVQYGNKVLPLGEFFDASGSASDDETLIWEGDCSQVKLIGARLTSGRVIVEGAAGMHLGAEMRGGEVIVRGDAGDWVGAEMKGGRIRVHGNTGHCAGAVYRGGRKGMTGGEILIDGNTGNELGQTMRRGLIAVRGKTGDGAGYNMLAGTLLLFGSTGIRWGAGMRRGTIVHLGPDAPPPLLPTFKFACLYEPAYLGFYLRHLQQLGFDVPACCWSDMYRRYCGDLLELGKGEILIRQSA